MYTELINDIRKHYTHKDYEKVADMILSKNGNVVFPVQIVGILKQMGFRTFKSIWKNRDVSGCLIVDSAVKEKYGSAKVVMVSENIKPGKRRFVAAHELAHYLFDFNEMSEPTYTNYYRSGSNKNEEEKTADKFAACLLMPKTEFIKQQALFADMPIFEQEEKLAEYFSVTTKAVRKRYTEVGLAGGVE